MDLINDFAFPPPIAVISDLLGIPEADRKPFRSLTRALMTITEGQQTASAAALKTLLQYITTLLATKRDHPGSDLTSGLVQAQEHGDALSEIELTSMMYLLIIGGYETTANLIGTGMLALLQHPDQYERISLDTLADEADALRASLGYERIILFGHSFGGSLALEYALRYGKHLDGLIVCDTVPVLDYQVNPQNHGTPEQVQAAFSGMADPAALAEDHVWRQAWMKVLPLYFHTFDPQIGVAMDEAMQYRGKAFVHGNTRLLPTFNVLHRLENIEVPTLVMAGRYDWVTPPTPGAERIHAALSDSKLVIFEQSGHFPFIEEQDKFIATVSAWMASLR